MKKKSKKKCGKEEVEIFFESEEVVEDEVKEYLEDILFGISKNEEKINRIN